MSLPSLTVRDSRATRAVPLPVERDGVRIAHTRGQWRVHAVAPAVLLDGRLLQGEATLQDGDVLTCGDTQLVWQGGETPSLTVHELPGNDTIAPSGDITLPGEAVTAGTQQIRVAGDETFPAQGVQVRAGSRVVRRLVAAVLLGLVLLLVAGVSRVVPLQLVLEPGQAQVRISGLHWRAGHTLFVLAGDRRLEAQSPGYHSEQRRLVVDRELAATPLRVSLQPLPGRLRIDTGGLSAQVQVDGVAAGTAPGTLEVEAGVRHVLLSAPRYLDFSTDVEMEGRGQEQLLQATLIPAWGWLELDSEPAGAQVKVDGQQVGNAPQRVELDAGLHQVELLGAGRRSWRSQVAIEAGQVLALGKVALAALASAAPAVAAANGPAVSPVAPEPVVAAADAPPPAPPARLRSPLLGNLILVPAGHFQQGSDRREQGRRANETLREVTLSRPFYLAEREVTNLQFRTFRAAHTSGIAAGRTLDLDDFAVSSVSWDDAVAFCNWLSEREGLPAAYEKREQRWQLMQPYTTGYRLPTEAEWEYAARYVDGQRQRRYSWGDSLPPPAGAENLAGAETTDGVASRRARPVLPGWRDDNAVVATVGTHGRTALGFADMGGNVSEWVHDAYTSLLPAAPATDPRGEDGPGAHVIRGANWATSEVAALRLAWRERADGPQQALGFRVARNAQVQP